MPKQQRNNSVRSTSSNDGLPSSSCSPFRLPSRPRPLLSPHHRHLETTKLNLALALQVGRGEEMEGLQNAWMRVQLAGAAFEVFLVSGLAGTGKTLFCRQSKRDMEPEKTTDETQRRGFFVLQDKDLEFRESIMKDIHESSGSRTDMRLAVKLMPALAECLDDSAVLVDDGAGIWNATRETGLPEERSESSGGHDDTLARHQPLSASHTMILFGSLLKGFVLSSCYIVLFLDGIQWSDMASRELVRRILTDSRVQNVPLVAACRDNELTQQSPANSFLPNMIPENKKEATRISLQNLNEAQLTSLLVNLFAYSPSQDGNERVHALSKVILKKTGGDIFYIVQILELLQKQHLLFYDTLDNEWTWDLAAITLKANASENVVQFLTQVIENDLPGEVRAALAMPSCLGFVFHTKVLMLALQMSENGSSFFRENATTSDSLTDRAMFCQRLQDSLRYALEEGLIESISKDNTVFKWSHDMLLECCYSIMMEIQDVELLHLQIGRAMHRQRFMDEKEGDNFLFLTVVQLNRGSARIDQTSPNAMMSYI
ncbi:Histidine kinase [Seminavis robusta]|uniref:Histidine kinase n=1 Tax=Seminavis robusta TaxID=568900 RepID=A0A9N8EH87_9STRA|nr:Histidine kinase [Seminavis robusta]|eukprot:Sro945_g223170.1 Histidine kinase (544) ;mRNA; f:35016-36736